MRGLEGFEADAAAQALFFDTRLPVYARILRATADPGVRAALAAAWSERDFHANYERPLLLCAVLHREVLAEEHPALALALILDAGFSSLVRVLARPRVREALQNAYVQTNEVTRAITWRLPLGLWPGEEPVVLVDIGCSAGLNLVADRLDLQWTEASSGVGIPLAETSGIIARVGLDRAPIDVGEAAAREWLRACLWPGQDDRRSRLDAALEVARAALTRGEMTLEACDAALMPSRLQALSAAYPRARVVAYQTIFADYLPAAGRASYEDGMRAWLARFPGRAVWCTFEIAADASKAVSARSDDGPVELVTNLSLGEQMQSFVVASAGYHPTSLTLKNGALRALALALGAPPRYPSTPAR